MIVIETGIVVISSSDQLAAACLVCGSDVGAGEGVTARYRGQTYRFKCWNCYARFEADPQPFLSDRQAGCCGGQHDRSPASEWT